MVLHSLEKLNDNIKKHALSFEWDLVKELTLERHQYLESFFENKNINEIHAELVSIQSAVLKNDNEIKSIINQQRKNNIQSSINLKKSFDASNNYQQTHDATSEN